MVANLSVTLAHYEITQKESPNEGWSILSWPVCMSVGACLDYVD